MSLILDALRKSEAERQRGHAPSLHSPASRSGMPRRIWPMAGTVAALALVGGTSWLVFRSDPTTSSNEDAERSAAAEPAAQPTGLAAGSDAATLPQGSLSTQPPLERESAPMLATDVALGNAAPAVQGAAGSGTGGGEWPDPALNPAATAASQPFMDQAVKLPPTIPGPAPGDVQASVPPPPEPVPPTVIPDTPQRVEGLSDPAAAPFIPSVEPLAAEPAAEMGEPALPTIYELDFLIRRELPKLNLSMHVYSKDPERRFALVNGKRYVPGGEAIDGKVLVIDVIPEGVVCEVNGQRFLLPRQ